jgi:hypothetical protein
MKYTIQDLADGKCLLINNDTLLELQTVLKLAFPNDPKVVNGTSYYYGQKNDGEWTSVPQNIHLPTQSAKDFLYPDRETENVTKVKIEFSLTDLMKMIQKQADRNDMTVEIKFKPKKK